MSQLTTSDVSQLARRWPCSTGDCVYNTWPVATLTQAVKPGIGSESRFLPTPPAFDGPVKGVSVGISLYIQLYSPSMVAQKATIYSNNIYTYNMAI